MYNFAFEEGTPAQAAAWLDTDVNWKNRKLRESVVGRYARDMSQQNWTFNGDTIKFDWNGKLLDGQHRLHALVTLNRTEKFLIVRGLDPKSYATIDNGARRSTGDMIQHLGSKHGNAVASSIRILHWYVNGQKDFTTPVSTAELLNTYKKHPEIDEHVARHENSAMRKKLQTGAAWPVISYLVDANFRDEFLAFTDGVANGFHMAKGNPCHTLRDWLINRKNTRRRVKNDERFNIIAKAWNAYIDNRRIQVLLHRFNEQHVKVRCA